MALGQHQAATVACPGCGEGRQTRAAPGTALRCKRCGAKMLVPRAGRTPAGQPSAAPEPAPEGQGAPPGVTPPEPGVPRAKPAHQVVRGRPVIQRARARIDPAPDPEAVPEPEAAPDHAPSGIQDPPAPDPDPEPVEEVHEQAPVHRGGVGYYQHRVLGR